MFDAQEMFADDVEPGIGQKVMDVGDAAHQRIFHRDDRQIGLALAHRRHGMFEGGLRNRHRMRQRLARREIGVGTGLALEGDASRALGGGTRHDEIRGKTINSTINNSTMFVAGDDGPRLFEIGRSIDAERHAVHARHGDGHARFKGAQLLQLLALLQR